MTVSVNAHDGIEQAVEAALQIALSFLRANGQATDEAQTSEFLAAAIMRRLQRGERHKILLANHAIGDYEAHFLLGHAPG